MVGDSEPNRAVLVTLVAHQRQSSGACLCGWSELGASHPEHVADAIVAALTASFDAIPIGSPALRALHRLNAVREYWRRADHRGYVHISSAVMDTGSALCGNPPYGCTLSDEVGRLYSPGEVATTVQDVCPVCWRQVFAP